MTRQQASERLLDYAYDEMSPSESVAFEALLREDLELQAELDDVVFVRRIAAEVPTRELPESVRRRVLDNADLVAGRRVWARRWERVQAFILTPAFAGAAAVVVVAVVGFQVLVENGPADLVTSARQEQVTVEPVPEASLTPTQASAQAASVGEAPTGEASAAGASAAAPSRVARAESATDTRKKTVRAQPSSKAKRSTVARKDGRFGKQEAAGGQAFDAVTNDLDRVRGGAVSPRAVDSGAGAAAQSTPVLADALAVREVGKARSLHAPAETGAAQWLAEARRARGAGHLTDALSLCRRALATGPSGGLLADVLAEAAGIAQALSYPAEADGYLDHLERLPGGAERAAAIRGE